MEFLKEEVGLVPDLVINETEEWQQSEKLGGAQDDSDDDLEEETLLETPLDKVEPYGLFKDTLLSAYISESRS